MSTDYDTLELEIHRVGEVYRLALSHTDPRSQARVAPLRAETNLAPEALLALQGDAAAYGRELAAQVFAADDVRRRFVEVERTSASADRHLRLSIAVDPSAQELHALRWELLVHPETGASLAYSERILLSRFLVSRDWRPVQLRGRSDLVVLVAVSAPSGPRFARTGLAAVDAAGEIARVRAALPGVEVRALGGPGAPLTLAGLLDGLRGGVDLLYLVSHGAYRRSTGTPLLFLQDETGDVAPTDGEALGAQLGELQIGPRLVVLASCQSAGDGQTDGRPAAQASLAGRLADAGVPAVLAMQGNVGIATIDAMMPVFFAELLRDGQVDRALAVARARVRARDDAWMPALFSRLRDGRLWYTAGFRTGGEPSEVWRRLLPAVRAGKLVPVLGPGLLRNLYGPTTEVAQQLAEAHRFPLAAHDGDDLPRVHQFLSVRESRFNVLRSYQDALLDALLHRHAAVLPPDERTKRPKLGRVLTLVADHLRATDPQDPHRLLAALDASVYVTTTFDPLLERALKAVGKEPQQTITRWRYKKAPAPLETAAPRATPRAPLVYHALGAFGNESEDSLVLTEDDYFDYLIGTTGSQLLPNAIQSALVDNSLLFIGFKLTDWSFRALFRLMMSLPGRERLKDYCHVAVQLDPELETMQDLEGAKAYLAEYFGQESNIDIYWGSGSEFLTSLHAELARAGAPGAAPAPEEDDGWDF